jgi:hypothetical protein
MNVLAENTNVLAGRFDILQFHRTHDLVQMIPHRSSHRLLIFAVAGFDVQDGNAPRIFLIRI